MQVHRLGEQQRHQHVAIQRLDDRVGHHQVDELVAPAPLEEGDHRHRYAHHHRADVRHHHRQADQQGQQRCVVEPQVGEGDVGHRAGNNDLDDLAANVIGDLLVHLGPDLFHQPALARQVAVEPGMEALLVLEEEEHQDRHQHQVDHDVHHHRQAGQRRGQRPLADLAEFAARGLDGLEHLLLADQAGIALGQHQQHALPFAEHPRQFVEQGEQLLPEQRQQDHQEQRQQAEEQAVDQPHGEQVRHPEAFQHADHALDQEGDHHRRQYRREHPAEGEDDAEAEHQHDRQHHCLLVGEVALHPVA